MDPCDCLSGFRFPAGSRDSPLPRKVHTGSGAHPASCPMGIVDYGLTVNRPERQAGPSAGIYNERVTPLHALTVSRETTSPVI
jgi:hypothetical protein